MKKKIYIGSESYGFYSVLTDEWNDAYYKSHRECTEENWKRYVELREEFHELHEKLIGKFGQSIYYSAGDNDEV